MCVCKSVCYVDYGQALKYCSARPNQLSSLEQGLQPLCCVSGCRRACTSRWWLDMLLRLQEHVCVCPWGRCMTSYAGMACNGCHSGSFIEAALNNRGSGLLDTPRGLDDMDLHWKWICIDFGGMDAWKVVLRHGVHVSPQEMFVWTPKQSAFSPSFVSCYLIP